MRLPRRLLLGYTAVIVILLVAGGFILVRTIREMRARVASDAVTIATALMDEIDLAVRDRIRTIRAIAGTDRELHASLAASNDRFEAIGGETEVRQRIEADDAAWRAAPEGESTPLMRSILENSLSDALHRAMAFHRTEADHPIFGEIFVTNRYGANAGQTGRTSDYRQDDETWWQRAWADGLWVADEVTFDESAGVHSLDIGVRVAGADGAPLGVIKAVLSIEVLQDILDEFGARTDYGTAFAEIVDARGRLVYRQGEPEAFGEDLSADATVREALARERGAATQETARGDLLRSFARSRGAGDIPPLGWALVWNRPTADAHAPIDRLRSWALTVAVVGVLAAGLVGVLITLAFGRMTQRIERAGAALAASEARVRSVLDNIFDGIVAIDPQGRIESTNPAVTRIFGYRQDEMLGRNVNTLMPEPYHGEHDGYLRSYLESGVARVIGTGREVEGLRKDGATFPLELAVSEIREGERHRFVGILRDVSERHKARRELMAAKEAAEAASRSKGQFLANMSHELRTPLNAVIGYAELVGEELEERDESDLQADVGKIRAAGKHLLGLINDVLDVSKIEAGRMELFPETFDLRRMVDEVAATVGPLISEKSNALVVRAPDELPAMHSDVTKVRQVLFNLLSNAAKFTRDGRITLAVSAESATHVRFEVADTGIGMAPEHLEHVWDAFQQADASTTREFGGTGLGLTITKSFAELLGGSIEVESERDRGTTFRVRLPRVAPGATPPADEGAPAAEEAVAAEGEVGEGAPTVLVIDDDPAAREIVRRLLARDGIAVVGAADGPEGLRRARELEPAAIVLDVMMPGMDGWAVLGELRGDPRLARIPVIMLTMANQRDMGIALGVDGYLNKPVDPTALTALLSPYCGDATPGTVLVVEDDAAARDMVTRTLASRGWRVDQAEHGAVALERLESSVPDILLVDLMMPVMDGFELVARVRADERWQDLPIVVLTAKEITREDAARLEGSVQQLIQKGAGSREAVLREVGRLVRRALHRPTP